MEKKKILIVDDEEHILMLLENRLSKAGYAVVKANNGKDAIIMARTELPSLIIIDILMPGIDGPKAVSILEEDPKTKDIPVIFLTALVGKDEERERKVVSGRYFIAKPFDPEQLLKEVAQHIK
ncbi:MAG: hypothetical protein A3K83_02510 [Omnitrophica WOR_2 bacterium RBG_13_44_8b]|nr:MAG: hypothetical protein A3K83_02510 [Omnitrophica WOR_2 bacterium RBG_13_44_8b]